METYRVPEPNFCILTPSNYDSFWKYLYTCNWGLLVMSISKWIDTFDKSIVILLLFSFLQLLRLVKLYSIIHVFLFEPLLIKNLKSLSWFFILKLDLCLRSTMLGSCWTWSLMFEKVKFCYFWLSSFLHSGGLNFSFFLLGRLKMGFNFWPYGISSWLDCKWINTCVVFHYFKSLDFLYHLNYRKPQIHIFIQTLRDKRMYYRFIIRLICLDLCLYLIDWICLKRMHLIKHFMHQNSNIPSIIFRLDCVWILTQFWRGVKCCFDWLLLNQRRKA